METNIQRKTVLWDIVVSHEKKSVSHSNKFGNHWIKLGLKDFFSLLDFSELQYTIMYCDILRKCLSFPGGSNGKDWLQCGSPRVRSLGWEDPLEKGMATTLVFLPGEFHGQRSLAGYSPWGPKELDMSELLTHMHGSVYKIYLTIKVFFREL